jgi:hypothetical protein
MRVLEAFGGVVRIAAAIFLAGVALLGVIAFYSWSTSAYIARNARPFESVRQWEEDHTEALGLKMVVKTKLISGKLLVSAEAVGFPKYLSERKNASAHFILQFLDSDGFEVGSFPLKVSEFTTIVDDANEEIGLRHQFDAPFSLERYQRFHALQINWNVDTKASSNSSDARALPPKLDHCAPALSKAERLKRLAQYGTVRENGTGSYSATDRSVSFFYDGSLLSCR